MKQNELYYLSMILIFLLLSSCLKTEKEIILSGYKEGDFTIRRVALYNDSTFKIEKVNFFDEDWLYGKWHRKNDTLNLVSDSGIVKIILGNNHPIFLFKESSNFINDCMMKEIELSAKPEYFSKY